RQVKRIDQPKSTLTDSERMAQRRFDDAEALSPEVIAGIRDPGQAPSDVAIRSALVHHWVLLSFARWLNPRSGFRLLRSGPARRPGRLSRARASCDLPSTWPALDRRDSVRC